MSNYNDKGIISLYEFFFELQTKARIMEESRDFTPEEIKEYKIKQLAIKFMEPQYVSRNVDCPDKYPLLTITEALEGAVDLLPCLEDVYDYLIKNTEGKVVVSKIDLFFSLSIAYYFRNRLFEAGYVNDVFDRLVYITKTALIKVYEIAINAPKEEYTDVKTGIVKGDKILNRHPKFLYLLQDEVVQKVFKNGSLDKPLDRQGGINRFTITKGNKKESGIILLNVTASGDELSIAERRFGYFDWAVMETVASIYDAAIESGQDNNGEILVDIKTIHQVLNHGRRMSQEKRQNIADCELVQSLKRLMGNYIQISEASGNYEGNLIEGELCFKEGKHCLRIKKVPLLLEYAKQNGRNYYCKIGKDELNLSDINYNEERVAIYRYLMQRTNEIFGSYRKDDKHKKEVRTNSIPIVNIIKALYPDFRTEYTGDNARSKKRDITDNVRAVLNAMKAKGYFDDFTEKRNGTDISFKLIRK